MDSTLILIVVILALNFAIGSVTSIYFGIRYWRTPQIVRPKPIFLIIGGAVAVIISILLVLPVVELVP